MCPHLSARLAPIRGTHLVSTPSAGELHGGRGGSWEFLSAAPAPNGAGGRRETGLAAAVCSLLAMATQAGAVGSGAPHPGANFPAASFSL